MSIFRLEEFGTIQREPNGILATFTARFPFLSVRGMALCRHGDDPKLTFIRPPKDREENRPAVSFNADLFRQIGERATASYNTMTGESLVYGTPPGRDGPRRKVRPRRADGPARDDTGLRRVLRADVAECMQAAGL